MKNELIFTLKKSHAGPVVLHFGNLPQIVPLPDKYIPVANVCNLPWGCVEVLICDAQRKGRECEEYLS